MNYIEIFLLALLFAFIVMILGQVMLAVTVSYGIKVWFQQREEYFKRMVGQDHQNEYENAHVN